MKLNLHFLTLVIKLKLRLDYQGIKLVLLKTFFWKDEKHVLIWYSSMLHHVWEVFLTRYCRTHSLYHYIINIAHTIYCDAVFLGLYKFYSKYIINNVLTEMLFHVDDFYLRIFILIFLAKLAIYWFFLLNNKAHAHNKCLI